MTKKSKKSEKKLKKIDEKKNKQLLKSRNKHLKKLKKDGVEDIIKTIEKFGLNTQLGNEGDPIQCIVICSERPTPRVSSSYNIHPISGELIIFGGEFYDGHEVSCFHDLYKWNIEKDEWKKVVVENEISKGTYSGGPKPRCSHQSVIFGDHLFIHGGEFSTEQQFYHFKDMWKLNLRNYLWEEVKFTGMSPSPRSGHRMVVWRHFFVVFGGFHDTVRETQYFNDIYIFNTKNLHWDKIDSSKYETLPSPRSGVQMVLCPNTDKIFICGGYSKIKDNSKNSIGKVHTDCWFLDMKPYLNDHKHPVWERINRKGNSPSPRSGFSMTSFKNQCILFGGVFDREDNIGLNLNSTFYNDLFTFDFNSKRWYNVNISDRKSENKIISSEFKLRNKHMTTENKLDYEGCYDQLECVEGEHRVIEKSLNLEKVTSNLVDTITTTSKNVIGSQSSDSKITQTHEVYDISGFGCDYTKYIDGSYSSPIPRINCGMFTKGNCVYIFGGLFESGKKILTLDDCWCFNILKKDNWQCILPPSINPSDFCYTESESDSNLSSDQETVFSSSEGSEYSDESFYEFEDSVYKDKEYHNRSREDMEELIRKYELNDSNKTPLVNESLGNFFIRTKEFWIKLFKSKLTVETFTEKEISRNAFIMANERLKTIKPFLELLRKEELKQHLNE